LYFFLFDIIQKKQIHYRVAIIRKYALRAIGRHKNKIHIIEPH